jgi:hypothetical protein
MAYNFLRGDRDQPFLLPARPARLAAPRPPRLVHPRHRRASRPRPVLPAASRRRARPPRLRPQDPAGRAAVRLRDRGSLQPADRAALPRGPRLSGAGRQPAPRPCDGRALPGPPPAGLGRLPSGLAQAVRRGRPCPPGGGRVGRYQGGRQCRRPGQPHSGKARGGGRRNPAGGRRDRPGRAPPARPGARRRAPGRAGQPERSTGPAAASQGTAGGRRGRAPAAVPAAGRRAAAAARAKGKQTRAAIKPRRRDEAPKPQATANVTDPDSRFLHTRNGWVQGYNAQAVTTVAQVIVAAELTQHTSDLQQLRPMLAATAATLTAAGIPERPDTLLADCGYWSMANLVAGVRAQPGRPCRRFPCRRREPNTGILPPGIAWSGAATATAAPDPEGRCSDASLSPRSPRTARGPRRRCRR